VEQIWEPSDVCSIAPSRAPNQRITSKQC
jgi:hypothetical protein